MIRTIDRISFSKLPYKAVSIYSLNLITSAIQTQIPVNHSYEQDGTTCNIKTLQENKIWSVIWSQQFLLGTNYLLYVSIQSKKILASSHLLPPPPPHRDQPLGRGVAYKIFLEYSSKQWSKNITNNCIWRNIPLNILPMRSSWFIK